MASLPLFDPLGEPDTFVNGKTPESRQASLSGARAARVDRQQKTASYIALLRQHGKLTDHQAAKYLGCGLSSINSIRGGILKRAREKGEPMPIIPAGTVKQSWGHQQFSYRTLWALYKREISEEKRG